jgi:hypothetical protein
MLIPFCFLGLLTLTPYEQDYLLYANNAAGNVRLTFICEERYCWKEPTKIVYVDINVINKSKTKKHTLQIQ